MGETNINQVGQANEPGTSSENTNRDNSSAAASTGTGTGSGKRSRTRTSKKADDPGLSILDGMQGITPDPVQLIIPGEIPEPAPPKKKKKATPKKVENLGELETNLEMIGAAAFGMVGLVTNDPEVWEVTDGELNSIAKPAARLIEKAGQSETTNKYSDYIMLLGALTLIVLPRIIATKAMKEALKQHERPITNNNGSDPGSNSPAISDIIKNDFAPLYTTS